MRTLLCLFGTVAFTATAIAQVATGDSRTITEPSFPAVCTTIAATKYVVSTTAVNVDPWNSTCGSTGGTNGTMGCTGGTSFEPSTSASSYNSAVETSPDNTAVQNALNACPSGQAVEITPGTSGQRSIIMKPFTIPQGVTLLVDAGVTVFASRTVADYGGTNCGIVASSSSCNHWITVTGTSAINFSAVGSGGTAPGVAWGIMGYGVLDGRGWDYFYGGSTASGFYYNRIQAYCNIHGGAIDDSPACTTNGAGNYSYGPNMLEIKQANNFTLYKITLKDAGNFFFNWRSSRYLTAWDAKILAPHEVSNTDGWDPLDSSDGTWTQGFISTGDNHTALKATSLPVKNITVSYTQTGAGVGLALGTDTHLGVSNILFDHIVQNGNLYDVRERGIEIASAYNNGGAVNQVTFQNVCMKNEPKSIAIFPDYATSGTSFATFTNIFLRNIHVLPSTAPYTTGGSGSFLLKAYDSSHATTITLDNVVIDGSYSSGGTFQYNHATLGPGPVNSSLLSSITGGTGDTTTGSAGSGTAYACTNSTWQPLIGELNIQTATNNNVHSYTLPSSAATFTLQATVLPATAISIRESPATSGNVSFYDNGTLLGTAPLSGNGTLATYNVASITAGTHNYTASYSDTNYSATNFGSAVATLAGGTTTPTTSTVRGTTKTFGSATTH